MKDDELLQTAIKTAEIVEKLGQQAAQQSQQVQHAAQSINQATQNANTTSERVTRQALEQFKATAGDVLRKNTI